MASQSQHGLLTRLWQKDLSLWSAAHSDTDAIANRLGWLDAVTWMDAHIDELHNWAQHISGCGKFDTVILLGMGGSSLAAEVFSAVFGSQSDPMQSRLQLHLLDTTSPAQINALDVNLERSLILVASKSGNTVETADLFAYFHARLRQCINCPGDNLVAITDANSWLHQQAIEIGFTAIFLNPSDIGGRYSALSYFGLVPAALVGVNLHRLLAQTRVFSQRCQADAISHSADNSVYQLARLMGSAALSSKNILELRLAPPLQSLAVWIEQLVAESLGKEAKGILPVYNELGDEASVNVPNPSNRVSVYVGLANEQAAPAADITADMQWHLGNRYDIGGEFLRWEMATAMAASIMDVNPFDQPDVEQAKQQTHAFVSGRQSQPFSTLFDSPDYTVYAGTLNAAGQERVITTAQAVFDLFAEVSAGALYLAMLAYLPNFADVHERLQTLRSRLAQRFARCTTLGYGPRYLHSTGQLHKGGPASGCFIQITEPCPQNIEIPDRQYSFSDLHRAQADGDYAVLQKKARPLMRITLKGNRLIALDKLTADI